MKFVDTAEIKVKAGDGGAGMSHFRREKYIPFGGPDGGNGGAGADVYLIADPNLATLLDFRYMRSHEAEDGGKGGTNNRHGKRGNDLYLRVPPGTVVMDADTGEVMGEVLEPGSKLLVARGGHGGTGNAVFASSRNQAPTKTNPQAPGELKRLTLELKMIADVAIIGAPNAGKSTLITVISAARPKVADYPFTTLVPTLGVVSHKDAPPFVVADVPGLIPGASAGKGLGHEFLRHIERTRLLIHLIDVSQESFDAIKNDYESILEELRLYNPELLTRPRLTVLSKVDCLAGDDGALVEAAERGDEGSSRLGSETSVSEAHQAFRAHLSAEGTAFFEISSAFRAGVPKLLDRVVQMLSQYDELVAEQTEHVRKI